MQYSKAKSCPQKRKVHIELIFKSCCYSNGSDDMSEDGFYARRVCPGDEDGRRWTGEPGIDGRATAFIARFYATRASDPERQTLAL
ncbi:hypothetical protein SADUNF_Sadunf10G0003200 [Salix dunnii]|uniref:Uncharacterized protein n=1 Tax=Salix dunnii TaxID=1413687 RepID=A0A835MQY7_9ROSI|nr:hypothetical protein SADUNF_Sadunf10G0003200 [Salix dunnii]